MSERVVINYSVLVETKQRIELLAKRTHRTQGYLIDNVIEQAWIESERDRGNDCEDTQGEMEMTEATD